MAHGQAVVGVVGASHVPGIANHWANAGHPESAHLTTLYLAPPPEFNSVLNLFPTLIFGARNRSDMQQWVLVDIHCRDALKSALMWHPASRDLACAACS